MSLEDCPVQLFVDRVILVYKVSSRSSVREVQINTAQWIGKLSKSKSGGDCAAAPSTKQETVEA